MKKNLKKNPNKHLLAMSICLIALAGCGGGGGSGTSSTMSPERETPMLTLTEAPNSAKSTNVAATGALIRLLQDTNTHCLRNAADDTPNCENLQGRTVLTTAQSDKLTKVLNDNGTYLGLRTEFPNGFSVARDVNGMSNNDPTTGIDRWWNAGWTGKGVKVAHLDDFAEASGALNLFGNRVVQTSYGHSTQIITLQIAPEITAMREQIMPEDDTFEGNGRFEISVFNQAKNLSDNGFNIINASLGPSRIEEVSNEVFRLKSASDWQRDVNRALNLPGFIAVAGSPDASNALDKNLLMVFSAGNDGVAENDRSQACTAGINECHAWAAAIHQMRANGTADAGNRILFVGSIDVNTNLIRDYSTTAGEMVNDFIVAGDSVYNTDETGNGTSQAAPRVVGVAALMRHRWPRLDGSQLKQLLLQTAEDLGETGPDATYGHGRLSLDNALSPVGRLSQ